MDLYTGKLATSSALAHLTRLQMLDELRIENCTFESLKNKLNLGGNAVNFHLRILENTKLVEEAEVGYQLTARGKNVFESLIKRAKERLKKKEKEKKEE